MTPQDSNISALVMPVSSLDIAQNFSNAPERLAGMVMFYTMRESRDFYEAGGQKEVHEGVAQVTIPEGNEV